MILDIYSHGLLKSEKVDETLTDMKIPSEVLTLAGTLADVQTKTVAIIYVTCWWRHWPTLLLTRYHKLWPKKTAETLTFEALLNTLHHSLAQVKAKPLVSLHYSFEECRG